MLGNQLYKVLDIKKFMRIKDTKATSRTQMPRLAYGLLLLDNPSLDRIQCDGEIVIRNGCWEFYIYDSKIAEDTKSLARTMKAVAYAKT